MYRAVGIDLGIRSGAVVESTFTMVGGSPHIYDITTYYVGQRRSRKRTPLPELSPAGIAILSQEQLRELVKRVLLDGCPIGIDWGLHEAFWGGKKAALQKAFLAGYMYRTLLEHGASPVFIPPIEIRRFLGLKANADKEQVHAAFIRMLAPGITPKAWTEHEIDATLLAIMAHIMIHDKDEGWTSGTSLPA